jgi:hypothetical protein
MKIMSTWQVALRVLVRSAEGDGALYARSQDAFATCQPGFQLALTNYPHGSRCLNGKSILLADSPGQAIDSAWLDFQRACSDASIHLGSPVAFSVRTHPGADTGSTLFPGGT